jgi:hypothetical protein
MLMATAIPSLVVGVFVDRFDRKIAPLVVDEMSSIGAGIEGTCTAFDSGGVAGGAGQPGAR